MRRRLFVATALVLIAALYVARLPPRALGPAALEVATDAPAPLRGVVHVHSRRSDGTGTAGDIAAAAARAGLGFVVLTDHGDGTRKPDPPVYSSGVLVIDAVEISTTGGHVIALSLPEAPYPLAGEPRDVVDDINRLGGLAIAAHPGSAKPELRWGDWEAPFGGVEWLNADSEWRDESRSALLRGVLTFPFRRPESVAALFDRDDAVMRRWDEALRTRRVVALPAPDAHARVGLRSFGEPYGTDSVVALHIPSYESMFRTMSIVLPGLTVTRDAGRDAAAVLAAIAAGRFYSRIDALVNAGALTFVATSGANRAEPGGVLPLDGPVTLHVAMSAPRDSVITIFRDGIPIRDSDGDSVDEEVSAEPAIYRVEVRIPGGPGTPPVPWLVSNPIYVGQAAAPGQAAGPAPRASSETEAKPRAQQAIFTDGESPGGKIERTDLAQAALATVAAVGGGRQLLFRYGIGGRLSEAPYAAIRFPALNVAEFERLTLTGRADHPMRLSVQLRVPGGPLGERWQRSIYLDETLRTITIPFADLRALGTARSGPVPLADIDSLLFVVDTVNTRPGGNGSVWLDEIRFER